MKWTPQKTMTSASVVAASRERPSESPTKSRDVLHLGHLVVVGEDHRVALGGERADLLLHRGDLSSGHVSSSETSSERAEWVSAPTEISSTPVSAMARMVSRVTPPEASRRARPPVEVDGFAQLVEAHVVEEDRVDADVERLRDLVERVALDLDRQRRRGPHELHGRGHRACGAKVVVLHEHRVVEAEAVVATAAAGDGVLLELAEAGSRLARVEDRRARALDRVDVAARERRDPGETTEEVERDALAGQDRALRAREIRATTAGGSTTSPSLASASKRMSGSSARKVVSATRRPHTTPASFTRRSADTDGVCRDGRVGRHVARLRCPRRGPRGRSARRCRSLPPCLEHGLGALSEDDMPLERLALRREVDAEVRAPALLTRERASRR